MKTAKHNKKSLGSNFFKLLSGVSLTMLGDGFTLLAIPWLATTLTDDALLISIVSAAMTLPWLLFSIPAGLLIDLFSHKTLMALTSLFRGIVLGTIALLVYLGSIDIIGKGIGGLLIGFGLFIPLLLDATTSLLTIPILLSITESFHQRNKNDNSRLGKVQIRSELLKGVTWVWNNKLFRGLALINIGLTTTFASVVAIQVLFVQENLGLGSTGFGLLMVFSAIGAIIAGQLAGTLKEKLGTKKGMLIAVLVTGLSLGLVGFLNNWFIVGMLYAIGSFSVVIWNVFRLSFFQRFIPEQLLGRVLSVFRFVSWGMSPIGMLLGGFIVSAGEVFFPRGLSLRLPYFTFIVVQVVCFYLLCILLRRENVKG